MRLSIFVATLIVALNLFSPNAQAQEYFSWATYERNIADRNQSASKQITPNPYYHLEGSELHDSKFVDELRRSYDRAGLPDRGPGGFAPFGFNETEYRQKRGDAYDAAKAKWVAEKQSADTFRQHALQVQEANRIFELTTPKQQAIRDNYISGSSVRPASLLVLGADYKFPVDESIIRQSFTSQEYASPGIKPDTTRLNVVMLEGSATDLQQVLKLASANAPPKRLIITLGLGFETSINESGVRGATALTKFLATNPEVINQLEAKGVYLNVYDKASGAKHATLDQYLTSDDWKKKNRQLAESKREASSGAFKAKLAKIDKLEKSLVFTKTPEEHAKVIEQIIELRAQTSRTMAQAYAVEFMNEAILEHASKTKKGTAGEILVTRVNENIAAEVGAKDTRSSGNKVDPAKAAKAARVAK